MGRELRRSRGVNDVAVEPAPALASTATAAGEPFEVLYRRTFPRVYAYVASLLRDRAAAEDVTAQAFERAYRRRRSFRSSRGTQEAWLFGIARNAALDELRRRGRRAALEGEPEDAAAATLDEHAEHSARRETVRAALASLEPRERDMVALKFSAGLSNAELAAVLDCPSRTPGPSSTEPSKSCERPAMTAPDRDLQTIDEALSAGRVTAGNASDRELQELALALRAEAAEPTDQFAEFMGLRVREGVPAGGRGPR